MAQPTPSVDQGSSLLAELARDLRPNRLIPAITTGLICGVLNVIIAFSFAALLFPRELSALLPLGTSLILIGSTVQCFVMVLLSSHPSTVAVTQDAPGAILAALSVAVLASLPASLGLEQKFFTIAILVSGTTLLTGVCYLLVGYFKLGALVRFLPYPVMGGFLAATGWPLINGALSLMTGVSFGPELLAFTLVLQWLPGLVFGALLVATTARFKHPLTILALTGLALLLFYLIVWLSGASLATLADQGWLFKFAAGGNQWYFLYNPALLTQVDWPALLACLPGILPILVVGVIMLLLNVTGAELIVKQDIDLNRELVAAGVSNLAGGLAGGGVCFHAISLAGLNHKLSGSSRVTGLVTMIFAALCALVGPLLLSFMPKFVLGGLLVFLGISFLMEWIVEARRLFPRLEYAIIVSITLVSITLGFLQGLAVGLVAAVVLFVINYSRINVVKHALSGLNYQSRVTRGPRQQAILQSQGEMIAIFQLQSYLFFGTANNLLEQVRARVRRATLAPLRFMLLDFAQVPGLDSTALLSFAKLQQLAQDGEFVVVFTGMRPAVQASFAGSTLSFGTHVRHFADLDRGLEWCEAELLRAADCEEEESALIDQLAAVLDRPEVLARLLAHLERREVAAGDYLIRQGDQPDNLYLVEQGQVTAQLEPAGQAPVRLETMRGGRVVGELGFYLDARRTAAVRADTPTVVYRLSQERLADIESDDAEAASAFHHLIVKLLAQRVTHLIRAVDALLR